MGRTEVAYWQVRTDGSLTHSGSGGTIASFSYTLDNASNRTSVDELGGGYLTWNYDEAYYLTHEARFDASDTLLTETTFAYDEAGNRLSQNVDGQVTHYTYNDNDQIDYPAGDTATYSYDAIGNLETVDHSADGSKGYTWNARDQLESVRLSGGGCVDYAYDHAGRRVQQDASGQVMNSCEMNCHLIATSLSSLMRH
jgi:YD repeat-containing protein